MRRTGGTRADRPTDRPTAVAHPFASTISPDQTCCKCTLAFRRRPTGNISNQTFLRPPATAAVVPLPAPAETIGDRRRRAIASLKVLSPQRTVRRGAASHHTVRRRRRLFQLEFSARMVDAAEGCIRMCGSWQLDWLGLELGLVFRPHSPHILTIEFFNAAPHGTATHRAVSCRAVPCRARCGVKKP